MEVKFYGKLAQQIGEAIHCDLRMPVTVGALRGELSRRFSEASSDLINPRTKVCVADSIVDDDRVLDGVDCVEILAPVSGG